MLVLIWAAAKDATIAAWNARSARTNVSAGTDSRLNERSPAKNVRSRRVRGRRPPRALLAARAASTGIRSSIVARIVANSNGVASRVANTRVVATDLGRET